MERPNEPTAERPPPYIVRIERQPLPSWGRCGSACGGAGQVVAKVFYKTGWAIYLCEDDLRRTLLQPR